MMAEFVLDEVPSGYLVSKFDVAMEAYFEALGRSDSWDADEHLTAARRWGVALLGSRVLTLRVIECLREGPGEGDVLAALEVLYDMGVVDLTPDVRVFVRARGPVPAPFTWSSNV